MSIKKYFEVIDLGLITSIQDMGWKGLAYYAIPAAGVLDKNAAKVAQLLLNKPSDWPLLECILKAPILKFYKKTHITLSGADFSWKINDKSVALNTVLSIGRGDVLSGAITKQKMCGYICLNEKLHVNKIYDSYSTAINIRLGGYKGRAFLKRDIVYHDASFEKHKGENIIMINKGPEYNFLTTKGKETLTSTYYTISYDSNRMGVRLLGDKIEASSYQLLESAPVLPGFIQIPPMATPIVVLKDGQTTGGYPRIGYISEKNLAKFAQMRLGKKIIFKID